MSIVIDTCLVVFCVIVLAIAKSSESNNLLLGSVYPSPRNLPMNREFTTTKTRISTQLQNILKSGQSQFGQFAGDSTSVSVSMISTWQDDSLFDFSYTSTTLNESAGGTTQVSGDSVFRIGSISKVFTVYALLLNNGFDGWERPITDYVPELLTEESKSYMHCSQVDCVQWETITLGALASSLSGIGRDYSISDLSNLRYPWVTLGLPELSGADAISCGAEGIQAPCTRAEFLNGFVKRFPVSLSQTTPTYSNSAFRILSYAIEAIVGDSYENIILNNITKPLGLSSTSVSKPAEDISGVIPLGLSRWFENIGEEAATGGLYSSSADLVRLGRAILSSHLLPPYQTRRWFKPATHTSNLRLSVGAPWEIWRTPTNITNGRVVDLYTKGGSIGLYQSLLVLIPDYDVAFSILTAGSEPDVLKIISEVILQEMIPVLEHAASTEAQRSMVGHYEADNRLNSSLVLGIDRGPGLLLERWISNGSDLLAVAQWYANATGGGNVESVKLYTTNTIDGFPGRGRRQSYRAIFNTNATAIDNTRIMDPSGSAWGNVDQLMYGNIAVDDFMFHFDVDGAAVEVELPALKISLKRATPDIVESISPLLNGLSCAAFKDTQCGQETFHNLQV